MVGRTTPVDIQDAPVYGQNPENQVPNMVRAMSDKPSGSTEPNPDFGTETAKLLANQCYRSSTDWLNAGKRLKWTDSLRAFQGIHPTGSKYLSSDYRYRSRLFRPKTRTMVRRSEAATAAAFFSNDDVVNIEPQDDNDPKQLASAKINQELLQYRLTRTIPWFLTVIGARQDCDVMGIAIGKAFWKYSEKFSHTEDRPMMHPELGMPLLHPETQKPLTEQYDIYNKVNDHPWVDLIAPENFRFDPGADWRNPVATSPYLIELIPMFLCDVRAKIDDGDWLNIADSALIGSNTLDDDVTRRAREDGRIPGKDDDMSRPRDFDICWIRENIIKRKGRDWHFYTLASSGELLSYPAPLEEVYFQGVRPYVCGFVVPEAHKTYPSAKVELVKDLQTQTNDVGNMRLDNVKLTLNPRQFARTGSQIDPQDLRVFNPGKVIMSTDPMNDVRWDRPTDVTAAAYQEQDRINLDFDDLAGGNSNQSIQSTQMARQGVGNAEILDANGSVLDEYEQRVFAETFVEPLLRQIVKLEQAYETDPVILAIAGKNANLYQKFGIDQITDELLQQELSVKVNVGIGATNPQKRLQNFETAAGIIGKLYGPAAASGSNFDETVKEVFGLCGYKDGTRFFKPGFDPSQAAQNGGKPGDDTQGKIQLAQAQQAAQAQQDKEYHQQEMEESAQEHAFKMEEMQQKHNLEMDKERQKTQQQNAQQMQQLATRPPALNIQSNALDQAGQQMVEKHDEALQRIGQAFTPIVHATIQHGKTLEKMLEHNMQGHIAMRGAIDNLTNAHLAEREAVRDNKGRVTGSRVKNAPR